MAEKAKKKAKAEMTAEIKSVDPAPEPPFFEAGLEFTRINKFTARYRVLNPGGAPLDLHHLEFDRSAFPGDDDFNPDFINRELPDDEDHAAAREKQAYFRSFMRFKMAIVK
jgi:hypothetical protein